MTASPTTSCSLPCSLVYSRDRKSTRLNSSHGYISYAVFCLKKKNHALVRARRERSCAGLQSEIDVVQGYCLRTEEVREPDATPLSPHIPVHDQRVSLVVRCV